MKLFCSKEWDDFHVVFFVKGVFVFFLGGTRHLEAAVLLQNQPLKKFVRRCLTSWP